MHKEKKKTPSSNDDLKDRLVVVYGPPPRPSDLSDLDKLRIFPSDLDELKSNFEEDPNLHNIVYGPPLRRKDLSK
jgi:hypothetical protein